MNWLQSARFFLRWSVYERLKDRARTLAARVSPELTKLALTADVEWADGETENPVRCWTKLQAAQPLVADWPLKLARAADMVADHLGAEAILNKAVARGCRSAEIDERLAFYRRWNRFSNSAEEEAVAIVRDPGAAPFVVGQAVGYLLAQGRLAAAREGLARIEAEPKLASLVRSHAAALGVLQSAADAGRTLVPGWLSPARDVIAVREPGADTTVIGFTTIRGDHGMPVNAIHALLQPANVNALYLYDERNLFNLAGSTAFGRPYPAMIEGLRVKLREWGTRTLITMGFSGAGFTALRVGLDLEAQGALLFSPVVTMHRRPEFSIEGARGRVGDDARMLHLEKYMRRTVPEMMTQLPDELAVRTSLETIEFHHGQHFPDLVHVYEARNVPGIDFCQLADFPRHECLSEIVRRGGTDVITRFVARVRGIERRWKG